MAMQEHYSETSITLSRPELRDILEKMVARPNDYVRLTAHLYFLETERPETKVTVFIYGEGPNEEYEI